jgi:hypothetical protein
MRRARTPRAPASPQTPFDQQGPFGQGFLGQTRTFGGQQPQFPAQQQTFQQQQQTDQASVNALMQALQSGQYGPGGTRSGGRTRGSRRREDGRPVGSTAPPANAGRPRTGRQGPPVAVNQATAGLLAEFGRQTAESAQPAVTQRIEGMHGVTRRGFATGSPISALGDEAIRQFFQQNPQCANLTADQVRNFLDVAVASAYNATDFEAFIDSLVTAGIIDPASVNLQGRSRWAGGVFAAETQGTRGARREVPLPSLLWQVVQDNCNDLDSVTAALEENMRGTLGIDLDAPLPPASQLVPPQVLEAENNALAVFVASNPQCAANADDVREFLALVDNAGLNGRQVFSLVRNFGLEGYLGSLLPRYVGRVAGMSFTPATMGVTPETRDVLKHSLLWAIAGRYCNSLPQINRYLYSMTSGRAAQAFANAPRPLGSPATQGFGPLAPKAF